MLATSTRGVILAILIGTVGLAASGQGNERFAVFRGPSAMSGPGAVWTVDATGQRVATLCVFSGLNPIPTCMAMAADNATVRVAGVVGPYPPRASFVCDIAPGGQVTTVFTGSMCLMPMAILLEQDGDWIVIEPRDVASNTTRFHRLRGNSLQQLAIAPGFCLAAAKDEETGLVIARCYPSATPGAMHRAYCLFDPRTGAVTTFAKHPVSGGDAGSVTLLSEPSGGMLLDVVDATPQGHSALVRVRAGRVTTLTGTFPGQPGDLATPGPRHRGRLIHALTFDGRHRIHQLGADGRSLGHGTLPVGMLTSPRTRLLRVGGRHLVWTLDRAPNDRSLHLSFPGEGGRAYVVGLSLAGVRPGLPLPDGRVLPLMPDGLTHICIRGGIRGVLNGTVGWLDAGGRARMNVNLNRFGATFRGVTLWATAVIFDRAAATGIAGFVGPKRLTIR